MSATLLEPPRRASRLGPQTPSEPPAMPPARPRPGRRVLPIALLASAAIHLVLLAIRFEAPIVGPAAPAVPRLVNVEVVPAMRAYDIVAVEGDAAVPAVQVVPEPVAAPPEVSEPTADPAEAPPLDAPAVAAPERDPVPTSVAERITPRTGDPRLWEQRSDPLRPELDPLNNVRARVYGSIGAFNDSIAAAVLAAERATDWTYTDDEGNRWGVSPGKIHLGGVTLPLPFGFTVPPGRRDEFNDRMRTFNEIQQQVLRAEVENGFKDRVRAIRAMNDAKRDSTRRGGGGP